MAGDGTPQPTSAHPPHLTPQDDPPSAAKEDAAMDDEDEQPQHAAPAGAWPFVQALMWTLEWALVCTRALLDVAVISMTYPRRGTHGRTAHVGTDAGVALMSGWALMRTQGRGPCF